MADRTANVTWQGSLMEGGGTITSTTSGLIKDLGVSWASRTEEPGGNTSPEELLAAAHASCFAMALSNVLAQDGHAPQNLDISATFTFEVTDSGPKISRSAISVRGQVEGIDQSAFEQAAQAAGEGCPVSGAIKGNVDVTVQAELVG